MRKPDGTTRAWLHDVAWEAVLVVPAVAAYFAIRNVTAGGAGTAFENGDRIVRLERALSLFWEENVQGAILDSETLVTLANWVYIWGHWPVILGTGIALFLLRRDRYRLLRNAMFISGAIGLVIFALLPVAPPRLGVLDIVDTITQRSNSYRTLQPPGLINRYAALPSLHFGWNLLVGVVLWQATRSVPIRVFAVVMPVAMAFAVVATGNHYLVDVLLGAIVALAGLAGAYALPAVRRTPEWARPRR